ncbi:MAG: Flp pilus assembly protein CpaB [Ardenticatenales bacterium]|nr:Flp pilus assembly protein CpaB [Ardenticatenales bacterium]
MRAGGRILMIFGVVLGIIAAGVTFLFLRNAAPADSGDLLETQTVIIAFQTIEPWQPIPVDAVGPNEYPIPIPADAVLAEMPSDAPPDPTTGITDTVSGIEFVAGKISNTRIYPGQIIVTSQLVNKELEEQRLGLGGTLSYIIPDGQVAMAIPIDLVSSIAGGLRSGDQVDIIGTYLLTADDGGTSEITQFFLQRLQILRVGPWTVGPDGDEAPGGIVTVLIEPQQALELKKIIENASWMFVLRSITDEADHVVEPVDDQYLIEQFNLQP